MTPSRCCCSLSHKRGRARDELGECNTPFIRPEDVFDCDHTLKTLEIAWQRGQRFSASRVLFGPQFRALLPFPGSQKDR